MTKRVMIKEKKDARNEPSVSSGGEGKPEWLVCTDDRPAPYVVPFKELFAIKESITVLQLLFSYNCYFVDVKRKRFIINGGRNIFISNWRDVQNVKVLYTRRNIKTMQLNKLAEDGEGEHKVSYLLGLQGTKEGKQKEVLIHVSSNGREWCWKGHR